MLGRYYSVILRREVNRLTHLTCQMKFIGNVLSSGIMRVCSVHTLLYYIPRMHAA